LTIASTETKKWILNIEFWVCAGRHQTQQQTLDAEIYPIKRNVKEEWRPPLFKQGTKKSAAKLFKSGDTHYLSNAATTAQQQQQA